MNPAHRLLTEVQWYFNAERDKEYPAHLLADQRRKLSKRIDDELEKAEADRQYASRDEEEFLTQIGALPDGWQAQVHSPTNDLRFSATGPKLSGHRCVVFAADPKRLAQWVSLYEVAGFVEAEVMG